MRTKNKDKELNHRTDLFLLRKEVLKLAGGMNGNRKTH